MAAKKTTTKSKTAKSAAKTAATKTATAKPATAKPAAPKRSRTKAAITKPVAAAKAPRAVPVAAIKPEAEGEVNKKALVERVMAESGLKKGEARRAVDAVLSVVSSAIREGKDIAAAPLGKIKIVRKKQTPNGELAVLRVKLRDPNKLPNPKPAKPGVADAAE